MPDWLAPYLGAFLIGLAKAGFATGLGMLTTPLLASAVPARLAIGILLPLLICADFVTLSAFWKKWNLSLVRFPALGALIGVAVAMGFVATISERFLRISIGATALVLTCLLLVRNFWYPARIYAPSWWEGVGVGFAAGFSSTISHGAGPIMAIFLMAQKADKRTFVATNAIFFTALNLVKLPPYLAAGLITRETLLQDLKYLPLVPLGAAVGWAANRVLPQKAFDWLVFLMLFVTSIHLLLS
jgi:uncharacterized protein